MLSHIQADEFTVFSENGLSYSYDQLWLSITDYDQDRLNKLLDKLKEYDGNHDKLTSSMLNIKFYCLLRLPLSTATDLQHNHSKVEQVYTCIGAFIDDYCNLLNYADKFFLTAKLRTKNKQTPVLQTTIFLAAIDIYNGKMPNIIKKITQEITARPLFNLNNSQQLELLNSIFLVSKLFCIIELQVIKYQMIALLFFLLGLYQSDPTFNENTIYAINKRQHIAPQIIINTIQQYQITDLPKLEHTIDVLQQLLATELYFICAQRDNLELNGAKSENLVQQIIIELAYRKLFLTLSQQPGLLEQPIAWFSEKKNRPNFSQLQKKILNHTILDELKDCQAIVNQHTVNHWFFYRNSKLNSHALNNNITKLKNKINKQDPGAIEMITVTI